MLDYNDYRAKIAPLPAGTGRPVWSVMIPTYNCALHLRQALAGVLEHNMGPDVMQIEVVDDHSTRDDPESVVEEVGNGRVAFYRQPRNVGHIKNFDTCIQRSRGRLIHLLHGDDCVRPGFYQKMQHAFERSVEIGAAFCRHIFMDESGHWTGISPLEQRESGVLDNWLERLALEQRIMTPSMVVRREVYETVGGFDSRLTCAEDWEMWVRIAAGFPVWYEVEPLALYRMHVDSNTGRHIQSGEDISFSCLAIDLFKAYLPGHLADRVTRQAKETYAFSALRSARSAIARGDWRTARAQTGAALACSRSAAVMRNLAYLAARSAGYSVRSILRRS